MRDTLPLIRRGKKFVSICELASNAYVIWTSVEIQRAIRGDLL